jgi:hypothetical protein
VSTSADDDVFRRDIAEHLADGESVESVFRAIAPNPDPGSILTVAFLRPVVWALRRRASVKAARRAHRSSSFPVARRMVVALTDQRLLVWTCGRSWKPRKLLGDVARQRISGAEAPTVGQGWRSVHLHLTDAPPVTIKVPARYADPLAARLSSPA